MSNLNVLVVEDDQPLREALVDTLEMSGFLVKQADSVDSAMIQFNEQKPEVIVSDVNLGDKNGREFLRFVRKNNVATPFIFMTAYGTVDLAVASMQEGASDFIQKPFQPQQLLEIIERYKTESTNTGSEPVVADVASQQLYDLAKKIAQSESTVLLNGPSGAGKEVMAKFIHQHSTRNQQPFVAINCAAIPENMLEATLFGYEKGAFTGAYQSSSGKFEQAQNGTLLLDEISEMDLSLQAKLLRVLQEKEVERLGGKKTIPLNVRIIATTNRNLREEVQEKRFREDLFYRLNVFPLSCLSLKERPKDIVPLAEMFIRKYATDIGTPKTLSVAACSKLLGYDWPGNVRELENVIQRSLILASGESIEAEHLLFESTKAETVVSDSIEDDGVSPLGAGVRQHEFQMIIETLKQCNGKKKKVAEELGISPRTLRYKLAKMRELGYQIPG